MENKDVSAEQAWQQWRDGENEKWRESHGWLTVTSLDWLETEPASLENFPGTWSFDGDFIHVNFTQDDGVILEGEPAVGDFKISADADPMPEFISGAKLAEIAPRFDRIIVRVRDDNAKLRSVFTGVPTFDYKPEWVVPVEYRKYDSPRSRDIFTAQEGKVRKSDFSGEINVPFSDRTRTMAVTDAEDPFVIFTDKTSGKETTAWRRAPLLEMDGGWVVDFNYSSVFPAHFTPFGTCPRPVAENIIDVEIPAGQKKPNETFDSVNA